MASEKTAIPLDVEKEPISPEVTGTAPEEVLKHANDADEAMKAFTSHEGEVLVLDEATNKRLLRKIDRNLMPVWLYSDSGLGNADTLVQLLCVIYGLNYLDSMVTASHRQ